MSWEDKVLRLEALRAIDDLIVDLSRAFDAGPSADMLRPLFADDATFVIDQYGSFTGAQAIADGVAGNADQGFGWTLHYLMSPKVNLAASLQHADVEFMLWEIATSATNRAYWIGGRYVATAQFSTQGWQFQSLELRAELISHYPSGWSEKPSSLADA